MLRCGHYLLKRPRLRLRCPRQTELDRFVEYVRNGAIITIVTAHSVTAEDRGEHKDVSSQ